MGCTGMAATPAALHNMLTAMSMSMPRIGYALTARTRCPSSEVSADMGSGGRGALRSSTMVLNRREVVNQGSRMGLEAPVTGGSHPTTDIVDDQEEVVEGEEEEMGIPSQATDDVVAPTPTETTAMEVDEPEPVSAYTPPTAKSSGIPAKAYPGQTVWHSPQPNSPAMSTTSRPISYSPGNFVAEPGP